MIVYEVIGKITVAVLIFIFLLLLLSLLLCVLLIKKDRLVLPRLLLFTIDTFYFQLKKLAEKFGLGEKMVDLVGIEVRNNLTFDMFSKVAAKERILVVPQCLRHVKCPARLDVNIGIACKSCGMCMVGDLKAEAEKLGCRFYVVPGGSFVERIVKAVKPKAAIGVACARDLNNAMRDISMTHTLVQGVPLVRDGCVHTTVDVKELVKKLRAGIDGIEEGISIKCSSEAGA